MSLEPFDFRSAFTAQTGFLTTWSQRWIILLTAQINSILNAIGIKSLNGDATPAQKLVAGANVTITDDGAGNHTIAASGTISSGITSINGDSTPTQELVNGTYIEVLDEGAGKHRINCTLTSGSGLQSINGDTTPTQLLVAGTNITITDAGGGSHTIASAGGFTAGGDLSGTSTSQTVIGWEGKPLDAVTMGSPVLNDTPQWDGTKWVSAAGGGTVTSVGMTMDGVVFDSTVSGSPVTTSGTLAPALLTQTKNTVLAGPVSGSAATPTFRSLVSADVPTTVIGFDIGTGDPTATQPNIITTRAAGSLTKCVITVTASDGSTDLSFKIEQNGVDVFSADPTVTHGTASGTVITYTSLTSSPLAFVAGDKFQYTGLTGTSSWRVNIQME